jgi:hypothetical protein
MSCSDNRGNSLLLKIGKHQTTRRHIPEDSNLPIHSQVNLSSHIESSWNKISLEKLESCSTCL